MRRALLIITVVVALLPLAWLSTANTSRLAVTRFRDPQRRDGTLYVPQKIYGDPKSRSADVVMVGGSSLREYFPEEGSLDRVWSESCGVPLHVFQGATNAQTFADSLAILDALEDLGNRPKLIVVGMTTGRLSRAEESVEGALRTQRMMLPASRTLLARAPLLERWSLQLLDVFAQLKRLAPLLARGERITPAQLAQIKNRYRPDVGPFSNFAEVRLQLLAMTEARRDELERTSRESAAMLAGLLSSRRQAGTEILYLFTPLAPASRVIMKASDAVVDEVVAELSKHGLVMNLRHDPSLSNEMFHDVSHLRPLGREHVWARPAESALLAKACPAVRR